MLQSRQYRTERVQPAIYLRPMTALPAVDDLVPCLSSTRHTCHENDIADSDPAPVADFPRVPHIPREWDTHIRDKMPHREYHESVCRRLYSGLLLAVACQDSESQALWALMYSWAQEGNYYVIGTSIPFSRAVSIAMS